MNNAIGESVSRLAKASGADVTVISYPSDVSLGIGKAVWAMLEDGKEKWESLQTESEQLAYLGECYVNGTQALEADKTLLPRIQEITKHLYEKTESSELDAYEKGKKINLDYFIKMTEKLGSHFDAFIYESEAGKEGQNIVRENVGKVFEESEGAVIYAGEKDGLHTRVFINKEGYPTYEAKDVGLMSLKFSRYNPDVSLFVTDHQQKDYFKVVVTAAGKVNPVWKEKTTHLTHGRMSFKGQKMSSRLGGVPIASDILDVIVSEVSEKSAKLSETEKESVALAALKFAILRAGLGKNINFDPDTSLSFEGDSGPYVQYTAIRAQSVLAKAKEVLKAKPVVDPHAAKTPLAVYISRFPEVVELAIKSWEPHHVAIYLLSVAQAFNSWYATSKIVDEKNTHIAHELALVQATHNVLKKGLDLLGIPLPEKM
jgi:arginyl-tRNA synthetase